MIVDVRCMDLYIFILNSSSGSNTNNNSQKTKKTKKQFLSK